ncbi:MAG: 16S rRNA (cytidine(1402)-2'-O)-methyltransferase [Vicinamibacteria bacterium]|nr:16S rRNA (cytidine(1402)-2'-O)-methyltransferase [Vicinamibacteria bacterium]
MAGDDSTRCVVHQQNGAGRLFVVATPLGNLEDISLRALRVLREVHLIACEDTRRTGRLLRHFRIRTLTTSFFEHNERAKCGRIIEVLGDGHDVALVSDAGTPGISDPGYRLVRSARAAGFAVFPVPGPNAAVTALSVSGLPTDHFLFVGFLPVRFAARRQAAEDLGLRRETFVLYESPVRILSLLDLLIATAGDREAFLCREATKLHEEHARGRLSDIRRSLSDRPEIKGEIVLVVSGARDAEPRPEVSPEELYAQIVGSGLRRRQAVKEVARRLGLPARDVYRRTLPAPISKGTDGEEKAPEGPPCGKGDGAPVE